MNPDDEELRAAIRLHLAAVTPRQRSCLERGVEAGGDARAALAAVMPRHVDRELARAAEIGARILTRSDPCWPPLLREIPDAPLALWIRGVLPDPGMLPFALVGPRRPTAYGLAMAGRLATQVAALGAVVVSGGAMGVDAAAHAAALASQAPTVAVLGCGVDVTYPRQHGRLYAEIAERGAVVSELPFGSPPLKHHFPVRNRLLAGWSRAVLVIEATFQSGSLITARLATEMGRDVLAVPGPVTSRLSEGTNDLLARGARVLRDIRDVVAELRDDEVRRLTPPPLPGPAPESPAGDAVLDALAPGEAHHVEEIVLATGLPAGTVLARLAMHEATGQAASLHGGLWMRSGRAT